MSTEARSQQPIPSITVVQERSKNHRQTASAHVFWPHTPVQLYAIVQDYDRFEQFVPQVTESTLIAASADRAWVYQRLNFPPPFSDRHYVIESRGRSHVGMPARFTVEWALSSRYRPPASTPTAIIPDAFSGCWDIQSTNNGQIDAVYAVTFKPGGRMPAWTAQLAARRYLHQLMTSLQRRLSEQHPLK